MLNPEQPYTRHRSSPYQDTDTKGYSYNTITYGGTPTNPWKITNDSNSSGSISSRETLDMHDVVTTDWAKKRSKGVIVNNPMEQSLTLHNCGVGILAISRLNRSSSTPYYYSGYVSNGTVALGNSDIVSNYWSYPAVPDVDTSIIAEALTEAWSRVSLNEAEVLVQLAESKKTIFGLISIFKRVLGILRALKRLDARHIAGEFHWKELRSRYLEARYALRPLMYDAKGILSALAGEAEKLERQTFRSFKAKVASHSYSGVTLQEHATWPNKVIGSQTAVRSLEVRAGILTSVEISKCSVWGFTEPFDAAWELIPFSFIVDWFFNVGKVIASWSPNVGLKTLASWYVVTDTTTLASLAETGESWYGSNYTDSYSKTGSYSKVMVNKYRLPDPSRPILPRFTLNVNWWKTLDLGSIVSQFSKWGR